jgi:hypothetical protein
VKVDQPQNCIHVSYDLIQVQSLWLNVRTRPRESVARAIAERVRARRGERGDRGDCVLRISDASSGSWTAMQNYETLGRIHGPIQFLYSITPPSVAAVARPTQRLPRKSLNIEDGRPLVKTSANCWVLGRGHGPHREPPSHEQNECRAQCVSFVDDGLDCAPCTPMRRCRSTRL